MEEEQSWSHAEITAGFSGYEFRFFLKISGIKLKEFVDWCHEEGILKYHYNWFWFQFGKTNRYRASSEIIHPKTTNAVVRYFGRKEFIAIRKAFAKRAELPFPRETISAPRELAFAKYGRFIL